MMFNELKELDSIWEQTQVDPEPQFEDVPDGKYQVRINEVIIQNSKSSGRLQLYWDLVIVNGQYANRHLFRYNGMETAENLKFLKQDLLRCGLNVPKLSELPNHLHKLLDLILEVQVKTKGEFRNIYINKVVGKAQKVNNSNGKSNDIGMPGEYVKFSENDVPF